MINVETDTDPNTSRKVLEAGPLTQDKPEYVQPARYFGNVMRGNEVFTMHQSKPSPALSGRSVVISTGRCVGGGSSINCGHARPFMFFVLSRFIAVMGYTRAAASDYDDWETIHGNPGWGSEHLIPLLKKAETYQPQGDLSTHGTQGPIKVSFTSESPNVASQFLTVASEYDKERGFSEDLQGFHSCNVYGRWPRYIDGTTGKRSDVPHHYIYNQTEHTQLTIRERRRVVRVIFEDLRAVGIEHVSDLGRNSKDVQEQTISFASKMVIVSAGAFGSPAILERSGLGGLDVLSRNNVPQIVDLPGVGEHYMGNSTSSGAKLATNLTKDHNVLFVPYLASKDADTMDPISRGSEVEVESFAKRWAEDGQGLMAQNGLDAGIKLRPNNDDLREIGPDFEKRWKDYFEKAPDKPVIILVSLTAYVGNKTIPPGDKCFSMAYFTTYPLSTGRVHISAGLHPYGKLDFEAGFLDDPADLGLLRWGYKKGREFARRMQVYRGEFVPDHPEFPEGSFAAAGASPQPVEISSSDIRYSVEDNRAIDEHIRKIVETSWHSIGTCAMKAREKGGVVDARLNVYGVQNLKVAGIKTPLSNGISISRIDAVPRL
ncbi:hypothetical protein C0992_005233 [Termitomyces sp. T32_za158]|nr:hypothetical protein C0992_005233 [Termitomyces sp. T32_za158]